MPTLRNKTTDSGKIIRWKPHPKHNRPSTYQVSPRAVSFLEELEYGVPAPGDEVTIPPQVCRPLRLLGDLYFETESEEDIELDSSSSRRYYQNSLLTERKLKQIRSYVETHPSYIGGFRSELSEEIEELPETENATPKPVLQPDARSVRRSSAGELLLPEPFYIGVVNKKSNNGNALLSTPARKHINLGRLPESIVNEHTLGVSYRGHWTMCLCPQYWSSGYRSDVGQYIDELERLTGLEGLKSLLNIRDRYYDKDLEDDTLEVTINFAGHGLGVGYHGEWTIIVDSELVTAGQRVRVKTEEVCGKIAIAIPERPQDENQLLVDDTTTIDVDKIGKNILVGVYNGQLVLVPRESQACPERLLVSVTDTQRGYVMGTVEALSEAKYPSMEQEVMIQNGNLKEYPDIPVELPDIPIPQQASYKLPVCAVNSDSLTVSAKTYEKLDVFEEDIVLSPFRQYGTEQGVAMKANGVPLVVQGGRHLPGVTLRVRPSGFTDGFVKAKFDSFVFDSEFQNSDEALKSGEEHLGKQKFDKALESFAAAVEIVDKTKNPEQWAAAIEHEAIAVVSAIHAREETDLKQAIEILAIRIASIEQEESIPDTYLRTLIDCLLAYKQILNAEQSLIRGEETKEKTEKTSARKTAKNHLDNAVAVLDELSTLNGQKRPHWIIENQLQSVADKLLIITPSVEEYIDDVAERD